jgi:pimeloyl-ACP methyl ester carboxylesterase
VAEKNVIFLHGFQDIDFVPQEKGETSQKFIEGMSNGKYRVHCLSYSEGKPTMQPLELAAVKLFEEVERLKITEIEAIIGHSAGGFVGCDFARTYPQYGVKAVIMLETPILGGPAWFMRLWRFFTQRRALFSWASIQDMIEGSDYLLKLNKDWPKNILRFEILGSLSQNLILKRFFRFPKDVRLKVFPKVGHDGEAGLRGDPQVLGYILTILDNLSITNYYIYKGHAR